MRRVRQHADFAADYREQLQWLTGHADPSWIETLLRETDRLLKMLTAFPSAGGREDQQSGMVMRRINYARLPYVIWYVYDPDDPDGDVLLVRLFHAKQERPRPEIAQWLKDLR